MRIGFDIRPFLREETGVGVYFKNLLFSLSDIDPENKYYLFTSSWKDRFQAYKIPSFSKMQFRDFQFPVRVMNFLWYKMGWPHLDFFFRTRLDLTHSPTPLLLPSRGKKIVTVYDLFFMDRPHEANKEARQNFRHKIAGALQRADGIVTISRFTKNHLLERFHLDPAKIKVVYLGLDRTFWKTATRPEQNSVLTHFKLPSQFLLFVGALERRKNLVTLLKAFKTVRRRHNKLHLVLAGRKGEDTKNILRTIQELKIERRVKLTGYCSEQELRSLYSAAALFVFPSFHEGFGLPMVEAMACSVPVAASRISAIPEIGQNAVDYFDPGNPEDMARSIMTVLEDTTLRKSLISRGKKRSAEFSWRTTAEQTLSFYQKVMEQ